MRLALTTHPRDRSGDSEKDARLTNVLQEVENDAPLAVVRPGLTPRVVSNDENAGRGLVSFNGTLLGVFGTALSASDHQRPDILEAPITWGSVSAINQYAYTFAEGNGIVLGIIWGTNNFIRSLDGGISWEAYQVTVPDPGAWVSNGVNVAFANGLFCTLFYSTGGGGDLVAFTSPDGITWTEGGNVNYAGISSSVYGTLCAAGDKFFVVGKSGNATKMSDDGVTWVETTALTDFFVSRMVGKPTLIAQLHYNTPGKVQYSTDGGVTWALRDVPDVAYSSWTYLTYADGVFYIADDWAARVYKSRDLITWTALRGLPFTDRPYWNLYALAANSEEVCVIFETDDINAWTAVYTISTGVWRIRRMSSTLDVWLSDASFGFLLAQDASDGFIETIFTDTDRWYTVEQLPGASANSSSVFDFAQSTV